MFKFIRHTVRKVDVFGVPIRFNFNGKETYQSFFGGIITLCLVVLVIILFQQYITDFSNKKTIFVETKDEFQPSPPQITLNAKRFMFAVKIEQYTPYAMSPYFIINITQNNYTKIDDGTTIRQTSQIQLEPCQMYHFSQFNNTQIQKQFQTNSMSSFLCPVNNTVLDLQGAFLDPQFNFVKFSVQDCNGYTNMSTWNVSCSDSASKTKYLTDNGAFRIVIYTTNYVINPDKGQDYTYFYLTEDLNFLFQPNYVRQNVNVYLKKYNLTTDQSLFIGEQFDSETYIQRDENQKSVETIAQLTSQQYLPFQLYLRSDFFNKSSKRSYLKADQVLAYFGGIFSTFFLVFGYLVSLYNQNYYKLQMANRLYKFQDLEKRASLKRKPLVRSLKADNGESQLELQDIEDKSKLIQHGFANKFEFLYQYFIDTLKKNIKVYPGLDYIIYMLTFKKKKSTIINKLVDQCLIQIDQDMDVKNLIKKTQEIDKLKSVLLNDQQIRVFNFSERPTLQILHQDIRLSNFKFKQKNERHFQRLLESYKLIVKSPEQKKQLSFTDQELIKHLSPEIQKILDASFSMKADEGGIVDQIEMNKSLNIAVSK